MAEITFYRLFSVAVWAVPLLVMLTAFGAIAAYTSNIWPWNEVVHESGNRTLLDTVFYFEHAARELPLDVLLGVAIGGSILWAFPKYNPVNRRRQALFVVGTVLVISIIIVGTIASGGPILLWDNLLQMHTRPWEALRFGGHWRYHFLSRLMLILVSFGLSGLIVLDLQGRQGVGGKTGQRLFFGTLLVFLIFSLVFDPTIDPFVNATYLGHQVREVFTHILVTVPLGWWVCLHLSRGKTQKGTVPVGWPLAAGTGGVLVGLYLLVGALCVSSVSIGQTDSMVLLIAPHLFEHFFSYLVVPLVAGLVYGLAAPL